MSGRFASEQVPLLLKCNQFRTLPLPTTHGFPETQASPTLYDEFKVLQYMYALAAKLGLSSLVAKPHTYLENLWGESPGSSCYSMQVIMPRNEYKKYDFLRKQMEILEKNSQEKPFYDTPSYWRQIATSEEDYMKQMEDFISQISKAQKENKKNISALLPEKESRELRRLIDSLHEKGYVHGDLENNLVIWKDEKQIPRYTIIDPIGYRPLIHYAQECKSKDNVKKRRECILKDTNFQRLVAIDQQGLFSLKKK